MIAPTLVLVGAERDGQEGFIFLDGKAPVLAVAISSWVKMGFGSEDEFEDHNCRIADGI
jgi:hypothetical protein